MMIRRLALTAVLAAAGAAGVVTAVHAAGHGSPPHAAVQTRASEMSSPEASGTADTDANAACVTNPATGDQTGNCTDAQGGPNVQSGADATDPAEPAAPGDSGP